jgi:hypothetical protein
MSWEVILKQNWEDKIQTAVEDWGTDLERTDLEEYEGGFISSKKLAIDVTFENIYEGDEDLDDEELFDMDKGWYRIEFSYPKGGNEIAIADFTYHSDYEVHEFSVDGLTDVELQEIYEGFEEF